MKAVKYIHAAVVHLLLLQHYIHPMSSLMYLLRHNSAKSVFRMCESDSKATMSSRSVYNGSQIAKSVTSIYPRDLTASPISRTLPDDFSYASLKVVRENKL
jgi:hypothetical protein